MVPSCGSALARDTVRFLTGSLGFEELEFGNGGGRVTDSATSAGASTCGRTPDERRGGVGRRHGCIISRGELTMKRIRLVMREQVAAGGSHPTPVIDRFWFKSVYFKEPGGVLFEMATEGPGFGVDEDPARLGETLVLPPWLESSRVAIERALPAITMPSLV